MKRALFLSAFLFLVFSGTALAGGFRPVPNMSSPRIEPAIATLKDGRVFVAGGQRSAEGATKSAQIFNPETRTWQSTGQMIEGRVGATASLLPDGRVLIVGGKPGRQSVWTPLASAEIFNPETGKFSALSAKPLARTNGASVPLIGGDILIWGGENASGQEPVSQIFNPSSNTFQSAGLPSPALFGGEVNLSIVGKGLSSAFRLGGYKIGAVSPSAMRYAGSWQKIAPLREARADAAGVVLPEGDLLIAGGWGRGRALKTVERFNGAKWQKAPSLLQPRLGADMVLAGGKPMLLSGWVKNRSTDRTEVLYKRGWSRGPRMLYSRWGASAVQLPGGEALLLGGVGKRGILKAAELYDPALSAPWVRVVSGPKKKTSARSARFVFEPEEKAALECSLDGSKWKKCGLKPRFKVRPGRHVLKVRTRVFELRSPAASWRWSVS